MPTACQGEKYAPINQLAEARRLAADLQVQLNRSSDASNRAVLADSDELSSELAREATSTRRFIKTDLEALAPALQRLGRIPAIKSLDQFRNLFGEYEQIDRTILDLAVENTNLKAQRLSFGPARDAADAFRDSLAPLPATAPSPTLRCQAESLASRALLAVREIQVLEGPHIAASEDVVMTRLESEMTALNATARDALNKLTGLVSASARPRLQAAVAALDRFQTISREIERLSRRNSNVRSVELSLRRKVSVTTACNEALRVLREALEKELSTGTR